MSDEEKKAIKIIKNIKKLVEIEWKHYITDIELKAIETLLTAYEKEKETNKQIKSKLDEKNIPIETLLAEFERLEDLEDDLTTVYLNGVYDGEKKVQDKIKAKIEEFEKQQKEEPDAYLCIKVLQSFLEKE